MSRGSMIVVTISTILLQPALARAQVTRVQATIAALTGVTDNANNASSDATGTAPTPVGDAWAGVNPTLTLAIDGPRLVSTLLLSGTLNHYFDQTQADNQSASLTWQLNWDAGPTWRVFGDAVATYAASAPVLTTDAVAAVPIGTTTFFQVAAGVGVAKNFSRTLRGVESVRVTGLFPRGDDNTQQQSVSVRDDVAVQFSFSRDAVGLSLGGSLDRYQGDSMAMGASSRVDGSVALQGEWLHELSEFTGVSVGAGAALASSQGGWTAEPVAHAAVRTRWHQTFAELRLDQRVTSNTLIGATLVESRASAAASTQLAKYVGARALAGVSHGRDLVSDGDIDAVNADAGVSWQVLENLSLDLAYSFVYQTSAAGVGASLHRNSVVLSVRGYYPVRKQKTEPFNTSELRVRASEEAAQERER